MKLLLLCYVNLQLDFTLNMLIQYGTQIQFNKALEKVQMRATKLNSFKNRLDRHYLQQEIKYNSESELLGTGSRSYIHRLSQFGSNFIFYL